MQVLQEKLDFLLEKYSVEAKAVLKDAKTVVIDGAELPVLAHRSERRFLELKNIVTGGTLEDVSVMRVAYIGEKGMDIFDALARELDICQYVLQRDIKTVMVMENGIVLNAIAATADGVVCTVEISATLQPGEPAKDKHEIIARRGTACDVVVDAQLKQDSIYVFGAENEKFTDVDFELYGLSMPEIYIVRAAFALAQSGQLAQQKALGDKVCALKAAAKRSAVSGEREVV